MSTITMHNSDCLPAMRSMRFEEFDLAIVDPPYGINATDMTMGGRKAGTKAGGKSITTAQRLRKNRLQSGGGVHKHKPIQNLDSSWDNEIPTAEYWEELFRVSKNQIVFGGNYFGLPRTRGFIVWDKKMRLPTFSQCEYIWTSFDFPSQIVSIACTGGKNDEKKIQVGQKPVAIYKWLLSKLARPGDRILDTHGGSLSIGIACEEMDFDLTVYEKDHVVFANAKKRLENHSKATRLFRSSEMYQHG